MTAGLKFVDELPPSGKTGAGYHGAYDELCANPGQWTEYWGAARSVYKIAHQASRPGFRFQGAIRKGKAYIRAVEA